MIGKVMLSIYIKSKKKYLTINITDSNKLFPYLSFSSFSKNRFLECEGGFTSVLKLKNAQIVLIRYIDEINLINIENVNIF